MSVPRPVVIDCETDAIDDRPRYPPVPVSVSIRWPGKKPRYHAWGHASANNSTKAQAAREIKEAYKHTDGVCFQNNRFDVDVIETHLGVKAPSWEKVHDTLFLLFLKDPDAGTLELKPAIERILGRPPDARNAIEEWLLAHQPVPGVKISKARGSPNYFMNYLKYAPGDIVGAYANSDTAGAGDLFPVLYKEIEKRGMLKAYERERRLSPIMLAQERRGLRVDVDGLERDVAFFSGVMTQIDRWLRKRLKVGDSFNLDSDKELLPVLLSGGHVEEHLLKETPKSGKGGRPIQYSTSKGSLAVAMKRGDMAAVFAYRAECATALRTYMINWLEMAGHTGGTIHGVWNQTRNAEGGSIKGTRTGRMSVSWFMNMPKEFKPHFYHDIEGGIDPSDQDKKRKLPKCPIKLVPDKAAGIVANDNRCPDGMLPFLPLCRSYVLAQRKTHVIVDRDYSQQEPRILAHFEDGELLRQYQENPWLDVHDNAKEHIERIYKRTFDRRYIKIINLGLIYGEGVASMALKMGVTIETCAELKNAILKLYPGLKQLNKDMRQLSKDEKPLVTWGDREYFCEPPMLLNNGHIMNFEYKMLNRLVQGSAADCTKEAVIRYDDAVRSAGLSEEHLFMLQVHDQMACSVPKKDMKRGMSLLRDVMESIEFDVKMLTEGDVGLNWGQLHKYDRKGKSVWDGKLAA